MFNASVKQFFDGFRSRLTLVTACVCYVTAPEMNLWAPVAGGLVCDLLFILHQRNGMSRFLDAAGVKPAEGGGGGPATDKQIKKAQMKLLKRDLDRRRRALAGQLMDSVDNSVAAGAKDFNVLMREAGSSNHVRAFDLSSNHVRAFDLSSNHVRAFRSRLTT